MHLKVVQNRETDSFIQALGRFITHRGNIRLIRCDNGTNFVGAKSELQRSLSEMKIKHYISCRMVEMIGSHGRTILLQVATWERQIKSARVILSALLKQHGTSLNDEFDKFDEFDEFDKFSHYWQKLNQL